MKIKASQLMTVLLLGALLLTGCSSNQSKSNSSSSKKLDTTAVSHKKVSSVKNSKILWNNDKDARLKTFISQWAPTMSQSYVEYDGSDSLKTSAGTTYPDDLKQVLIDGNKTSIGWNKKGNGNYKYNVVAIYNYNSTESSAENHITYFFAFHEGQPIVLVDQSTNGTPNLTATKNATVKSGFENIVNGKEAKVSSTTSTAINNSNSNDNNSSKNDNSSSSTQAGYDFKTVGVMLYEFDRNFDMSDDPQLKINTSEGRYWIGTGSANSTLSYTVEGDTAHYWTKPYNGNDIRPDGTDGPAPETEHTIKIADLTSKYYSTDDQKQMVDQVTGHIEC